MNQLRALALLSQMEQATRGFQNYDAAAARRSGGDFLNFDKADGVSSKFAFRITNEIEVGYAGATPAEAVFFAAKFLRSKTSIQKYYGGLELTINDAGNLQVVRKDEAGKKSTTTIAGLTAPSGVFFEELADRPAKLAGLRLKVNDEDQFGQVFTAFRVSSFGGRQDNSDTPEITPTQYQPRIADVPLELAIDAGTTLILPLASKDIIMNVTMWFTDQADTANLLKGSALLDGSAAGLRTGLTATSPVRKFLQA